MAGGVPGQDLPDPFLLLVGHVGFQDRPLLRQGILVEEGDSLGIKGLLGLEGGGGSREVPLPGARRQHHPQPGQQVGQIDRRQTQPHYQRPGGE